MPTESTPVSPYDHSTSTPGRQKPEDQSAAVEPSGVRGDNPATAGTGNTQVHSPTPENRSGKLNPSAPEDANTTPGSTSDK